MAFKMKGSAFYKKYPLKQVPPGEGELNHDVSYATPANPEKLKGLKPSTGLLEELGDYGPGRGLVPAYSASDPNRGAVGLTGKLNYGPPGVEERRDSHKARKLGDRVFDEEMNIHVNQEGHKSESQKDAINKMKKLEERLQNNVGTRG